MEQLICIILIIALGFYVFKCFPFPKGKVNYVVIAALFIVLTLICKSLAIKVPLFGVESLKISVEYIPLMVAGIFLPPSYAFIIGLSCDLIGLILVPTSFPFLGFTLGLILVSVIPSLIKEYSKFIDAKYVEKFSIILIWILAIGASTYIYFLKQFELSKQVYYITTFQKSLLTIICFGLAFVFTVILIQLKKRIKIEEGKDFAIWMLSVVIVEIVVTLCITPLNLQIMYGIPFLVSMCIRIIKACFVIPLNIFLGYTIIKFMKKMIKL